MKVLVPPTAQHRHRVGTPHLFGDDGHDGHVGLLCISSPCVYPQTDTYRRTIAQVDIDEADAYTVDIFRVASGDQHHYSFHGAASPVSTTDLSLVDQQDGTYAGPDVPRPEPGEVTDYDESVGSGFNYLTNVTPRRCTTDLVHHRLGRRRYVERSGRRRLRDRTADDDAR